MNSKTKMTVPALIDRYGSSSTLAEIPWHELPAILQNICWKIIKSWFNHEKIDRLREVSGLNDMTLAELLEAHDQEQALTSGNRYHLISYMRIEPEEDAPLTYGEALAEKEQQEMMCPENLHIIEEV